MHASRRPFSNRLGHRSGGDRGCLRRGPGEDWLTLAHGVQPADARSLSGNRRLGNNIDPLLAASMDWAADNLSVLEVVRAEDACHRLNTRLVELFQRRWRLLVTPTVAACRHRVPWRLRA